MRELCEADFHKPGMYGSGRVWANARDVAFRAPSRGGRGRWADVGFVVCLRWGGIFFVLSLSLHFQIRRSRAVSIESVKGLRQPANNLPTENSRPPRNSHQVYRLVCSHLRNMTSAVDQCSSSQPNQEASLIFDPTSVTSTSFFQASRASVAIDRETEDSSRRKYE